MSVAALVLAGGRGERLAHPVPKAFAPLAGEPLIAHSIATLAAVREIDLIVPVVSSDWIDRFSSIGLSERPELAARLAAPVAGGPRRQDSMAAGLAALGERFSLVAVHDAARALVRPEAVSRVLEAARVHGAALLAAPARDTIKRVAGGRVVETPPRETLWAAQTPQVFRTELLREAAGKASAEGREATDDAQMVEWLGVPVHVVAGDADNLKITHPWDLAIAEQLLARRRERDGAAA